MMSEKLFETALGIAEPWCVADVELDAPARTLTIRIDFISGSRFAVEGEAGTHPVHDTVSKRYRHLNFFQHECYLEVRVPRVKLPDWAVRQIEPIWAGKLSGFTLLFEVLMRARAMPFAAVARLVGEAGTGWRRSASVTSSWRWPRPISLRCAVLPSTRPPEAIELVSLDMSPAFIKGLRWKLLRDYHSLNAASRVEIDGLLACLNTRCTARAWVYREPLREILDRKQINVVSRLLKHWCTNVMRSRVEPMKEVAQMIRNHFDDIVAWAQACQTNGFLEALNGLFQSAKRKARGYGRFSTIRTVIFLIAGKLDFSKLNPHVAR